jgi:hypothetical protein
MRCVAARFGVLVGLGVEVGLSVAVGVAIFVAVGSGVDVLVGTGGADVEQAETRKSITRILMNKGSDVVLRCIYPP